MPGFMTIFGVIAVVVSVSLINKGAEIKQRDKHILRRQVDVQMRHLEGKTEE
jgi:hypothetical protein